MSYFDIPNSYIISYLYTLDIVLRIVGKSMMGRFANRQQHKLVGIQAFFYCFSWRK